MMPDEGFEPSPPKRLDLKSSALDHSAKRARFFYLFCKKNRLLL